MKRIKTIVKGILDIKEINIICNYNSTKEIHLLASWDYYYSLSGYLNGEYFSLYLYKHKEYKERIIEFGCTTKCSKELTKELLKIEPKLIID